MNTLKSRLLEHQTEFLAFARKRLADPQLAEDVLQESLLKALKAADQLKSEESFKAWFYRIIRHVLIDLYRRRDVHARAIHQLESEAATPTFEEERVACACLHDLLPTLAPQYALLIQRHELNGESLDVLAESLGVTKNNLTVRLHRARQQLKERLIETCQTCATHGCVDCSCNPVSL